MSYNELSPLLTIGYSGLSVPEVKAFLDATGARLADIRRSPYSRDRAWCREPLRGVLGPQYVFLGWSLGNSAYATPGAPIRLVGPEKGVLVVGTLLQVQPVVLTCVCRQLATCHRRIAAELIREATGCEVRHLRTEDVRTPNQLDLLR